ncbi:hypothetical protein MY4038_007743 [Beauveria bassiana]
MAFKPQNLEGTETIVWKENSFGTFFGNGGMIYWMEANVTNKNTTEEYHDYRTGKGLLAKDEVLYIYGGKVYQEAPQMN